MTPRSRSGPRTIEVHRVYEPRPPSGKRYLVERLWPRGVRKQDLRIDGWIREVSPTPELRRWFGHDPAKWDEFRRRYFAELDRHPEAWRPLLDAATRGRVILLFSARDEEHNNAVALKEYLERHGRRGRRRTA